MSTRVWLLSEKGTVLEVRSDQNFFSAQRLIIRFFSGGKCHLKRGKVYFTQWYPPSCFFNLAPISNQFRLWEGNMVENYSVAFLHILFHFLTSQQYFTKHFQGRHFCVTCVLSVTPKFMTCSRLQNKILTLKSRLSEAVSWASVASSKQARLSC